MARLEDLTDADVPRAAMLRTDFGNEFRGYIVRDAFDEFTFVDELGADLGLYPEDTFEFVEE